MDANCLKYISFILILIKLFDVVGSEFVSFKFVSFQKEDDQPLDFVFEICIDRYNGDKDDTATCLFYKRYTKIIHMSGTEISFEQFTLLQNPIIIDVADTEVGVAVKVNLLSSGLNQIIDKYFHQFPIPPDPQEQGITTLKGGESTSLVVSFMAIMESSKHDNSLSMVQTIGLVSGVTIVIIIIFIVIIVLAVIMIKRRRKKQQPKSRDNLASVSQQESEDIDNIPTVHQSNPRSRSNMKGQDVSKLVGFNYEDAEFDENNELQAKDEGITGIDLQTAKKNITKESPLKGEGISEDEVNFRPNEGYGGGIGRCKHYSEEKKIYENVGEPKEIPENKYNQEKDRHTEETKTYEESAEMGYKSGPKSDEDPMYAVSAKSSNSNGVQNLGEVKGYGYVQKGETVQGILPLIDMELTSVEGVDEDEMIYAEIEFPPIIPPRDYDNMYKVTKT